VFIVFLCLTFLNAPVMMMLSSLCCFRQKPPFLHIFLQKVTVSDRLFGKPFKTYTAFCCKIPTETEPNF